MFLSTLRHLLDLLSPQERRRAYLLLVMVLVMAVFDAIGIAAIMPFLSALADPTVVNTNQYFASLNYALGSLDPKTFLYVLGVFVFVLLVVSIAFKAFTVYCVLRFTHMRQYSIGRRLVAGYLSQPYEWFLNRNSAELGKTILSEVNQVVQGAMIPMMNVIAQGTVAFALVSLIVLVNPWLAVFTASVLGGTYGAIYLLLRSYLLRIGTERVNVNKDRFAAVQEAFGGIKDVKIGGLESEILKRFEVPAKRYARSEANSNIIAYLPRYVLEAVAFGGMILVILFMMADSDSLQTALPVIGLYAMAGYRLMPALQQVFAQLTNLRFSKPALDALHADLQQIRSVAEQDKLPTRCQPLGLSSHLRLEQVTYSYPSTQSPALLDITMEFRANTTVGIVGSSGSGKTTTVDLILGLLQPQSGSLFVDDTEITADNLRAWQRTIGYVPQEIYLSDASIAANIAYGIRDELIDMSAVEKAARVANLHAFIEADLPKGYQTLVGERGARLSGGQRQRIGIARALYHDPPVLILDEATSALDNLTERAVMDAIDNLSQEKTIIVIAHRLSTVEKCDEIYLLERGRIAGHGKYDLLIAENEHFRVMANGLG